jgi:hypothetical protein
VFFPNEGLCDSEALRPQHLFHLLREQPERLQSVGFGSYSVGCGFLITEYSCEEIKY